MTISEFIYTVLLKPRPLKALANRVIKGLLPASTRVAGAKIYLNPNDPVISGALALRVYERDEIAFFKQHFSPQMNFIDIGANVGLYSALALASGDYRGTLLCLEPHSQSRQYLQQTLDANKPQHANCRIIVSDRAAADTESETVLHSNPENKGDNRLYDDDMLSAAETVHTATLDALCRQYGIESVDFVKIDVQGGEDRAIAGGSEILKQSQHCIVLSEFWPHGLTRAGSSAERYLQRLEQLGFKLYRLGKHASLSPLDKARAIQHAQGRKYLNIAGFKGKYLDQVES